MMPNSNSLVVSNMEKVPSTHETSAAIQEHVRREVGLGEDRKANSARREKVSARGSTSGIAPDLQPVEVNAEEKEANANVQFYNEL